MSRREILLPYVLKVCSGVFGEHQRSIENGNVESVHAIVLKAKYNFKRFAEGKSWKKISDVGATMCTVIRVAREYRRCLDIGRRADLDHVLDVILVDSSKSILGIRN